MNQDIGYKLKLITDKLKVRADVNLKRHQLTLTQSRVLAFLKEREGAAKQKEIEDYLQVAHPTVAGIVSRMEQSGFVETWLDPEDRRNKIVRLTDKADQIGREMDAVVQENEQALLKSFSPAEKDELKRLLDMILKNVT